MEDKLRVRGQIISAFEDVPLPAEGEIILSPSSGDKAGESSIREALACKRWDELSVGFLKDHWSSFCYLSAKAFRYYLPALLISSLDNPENDRSFYHTVLFELNPSAHAIYYKGADSHFNIQTSLFTWDQFRAVAAYLGLFLTNEDPYSLIFLAGQAFRWGWDRVETPEREAFGAFYHRMHHFEYPDPTDPSVAGLVHEIRQAFAETPYPGDNNLSDSEQGDEPAECALEFRGLNWREIHPHLLGYNYTSLSFLTAEGFRYFLPAYLIAELTGLAGDSNASPDFHLTHGFATPRWTQKGNEEESVNWFDYGARRMAVFSKTERQAIIRYLEHLAENDEVRKACIDEALDRYWRASLQTKAS